MTSKEPPIFFGAWWILKHTNAYTRERARGKEFTEHGERLISLKIRYIEGLLNRPEKMSKNSIDSVWHGQNIYFVDEMFHLWPFQAVYCFRFDAFFVNLLFLSSSVGDISFKPVHRFERKNEKRSLCFKLNFQTM